MKRLFLFCNSFYDNPVTLILILLNSKKMKKLILFAALVISTSAFVSAQQIRVGGDVDINVILGNRPPSPSENQLLIREEREHPNIAKAMHDLQDGLAHLNAAPSDFGGHKGQAINDMRAALISLRKALYFRLYHGG